MVIGDASTQVRRGGVRSLLANASALAGSNAVGLALKAGYAVLLARLLGPEQYGWLQYGLGWIGVLSAFAMLGTGSIMAREVGRDSERGRAAVQQTFSLLWPVGVVLVLVSLSGARILESDFEMRRLLVVLSFAMAARGVSSWTTAAFTAHERARFVLPLESGGRLLEVGVGSLVLLAGGGVLQVALIHCASWWLQAALSLYWLNRRVVPLKLVWEPGPTSSLIADGVPLMLSGLATVFLLQAPVLLFRHQPGVSDADLGQLSLALQVPLLSTPVVQALRMAAVPIVARAAASGGGLEGAYLEVMLRAGWLVAATGSLVALAFGAPLVGAIFGSAYPGAGALLPFAAWLVAPLFWNAGLMPLQIAHGWLRSRLAWAALGAGVVVLVFRPWVASFAGAGALLAALTGWVVCVAGMLWPLRARGSVDLGRCVLRPAVSVALAFAAFHALRSFGPTLALAAALAVLTASGVFLRVVSAEEYAALRAALRRRGGG